MQWLVQSFVESEVMGSSLVGGSVPDGRILESEVMGWTLVRSGVLGRWNFSRSQYKFVRGIYPLMVTLFPTWMTSNLEANLVMVDYPILG